MRKINIGAGPLWKSDGWESLDNVQGTKPEKWQHFGKCWETNLPSNVYDIVFTSHTLEHIPQFRIEKTFYEINRIMKIGGTIRILVPDLYSTAKAYVSKNKSFFRRRKNYDEGLGIGHNFVRQIVSPGGQTIALNCEYDEIIGGYAHLYCYDFDSMSKLLKKWGFSGIKKCSPGKSSILEMRPHQHFVCDDKKYDMKDNFIVKKKYLEKSKTFYQSGFDKSWTGQLVVEAKKNKNVNYNNVKEFSDFQQMRFNSHTDNLKIKIFYFISNIIDSIYNQLTYLRINVFLKKFLRTIVRR